MASKWSKYDSVIKDVIEHEESNSKAAREVFCMYEYDYTKSELDLLRTYIKRFRRSVNEEYDGLNKVTDSVDVENKNLKHVWIKTPEASGFFKNPNYDDGNFNFERDIDFDSTIKNYLSELDGTICRKFPNAFYGEECLFDRLVYTDTHIGMDVNSDGFSLYYGKWDEEEINRRLDVMIDFTIANQKSNTLLIHDLGDFMDGYDAKTTRGGHALPQNMDNQKAFDVGFNFKAKLVDRLYAHYDKIFIVNICNDNHSGAFGYMVNSAVKSYLDMKYEGTVETINQREFINHYKFFNRVFVLTHGKDGKNLKFGFKVQLDPAQIEKIKNFLDENDIHESNVEFSKGDSHQWLFDLTSSTAFHYQNFGAISPPSDWVKTNFKNTKSMFTLMHYYEDRYAIENHVFKKQLK